MLACNVNLSLPVRTINFRLCTIFCKCMPEQKAVQPMRTQIDNDNVHWRESYPRIYYEWTSEVVQSSNSSINWLNCGSVNFVRTLLDYLNVHTMMHLFVWCAMYSVGMWTWIDAGYGQDWNGWVAALIPIAKLAYSCKLCFIRFIPEFTMSFYNHWLF